MSSNQATVSNVTSSFFSKIIHIFIVLSVPIMLFLIFVEANAFSTNINKEQIIESIKSSLGADRISDESIFNGLISNPVIGSLILALVFGLLVSLAMKTDVPIPVWFIAVLSTIALLMIGMSSWAIPIVLVYVSEAIQSGMIIESSIWLFLISVGSALLIGIGFGWYLKLAANSLRKAFDMSKHNRRYYRTSYNHNNYQKIKIRGNVGKKRR